MSGGNKTLLRQLAFFNRLQNGDEPFGPFFWIFCLEFNRGQLEILVQCVQIKDAVFFFT